MVALILSNQFLCNHKGAAAFVVHRITLKITLGMFGMSVKLRDGLRNSGLMLCVPPPCYWLAGFTDLSFQSD